MAPNSSSFCPSPVGCSEPFAIEPLGNESSLGISKKFVKQFIRRFWDRVVVRFEIVSS